MFLLSLLNWRFRPRFRPILYGSGKEPDMFYTSATRLHGNAPQWGEGAGGIPDFKWPGWPKGSCVGLKFSISGFFWVGKFWQVFFWKPAPAQIVAILSVRRVTRLQAFTTQTVQKRARFRCLHESAQKWNRTGQNFWPNSYQVKNMHTLPSKNLYDSAGPRVYGKADPRKF